MVLLDIAKVFEPKLVEFADGSFGIRVRLLFRYVYIDLETCKHKWERKSYWFKYCKGSKERATEVFTSLYDKGTIVK